MQIARLPTAPVSRVEAAARAFEGQALGAMFAPMFETVNAPAGLFGGGPAEATWRPILTQAIADRAAARGGVGIADALLRQLLATQEAAR